jgi:hypothetical protein
MLRIAYFTPMISIFFSSFQVNIINSQWRTTPTTKGSKISASLNILAVFFHLSASLPYLYSRHFYFIAFIPDSLTFIAPTYSPIACLFM